MKEKWVKHKTVYLLFLLLTILFYGNSLKNKYSLDDDYITVTNFPTPGQPYTPNHKLVKEGFKGIPKIWLSRYAHDSEAAFDYRPVVTTTFAIEYGIFGQNPLISHLINLILYFVLICLLFDVLILLFENEKSQFFLAFATSLLFLIHPLHTEVVDSLKCRDELLALFFSLKAVVHVFSFIKKPNYKSIILIVVFLFLAFFSKLSTVLVMIAIPLMVIFYRKREIKKVVILVLGLVVLYNLFQAFSNFMPNEELVRVFYGFENPLFIETTSFFERIIVGFKTYGFYIKLLIFPFPLRFYYGANMFDVSSSLNMYFFIAIIFIGCCVAYYFKTKEKVFLFSFLLLGLLMAPFLNVFDVIAGIVGERLMFIPSIGFCLLITVILKPYFGNFNFEKISNLFSKPLIYLLPLIFTSMLYTTNRNAAWETKVTLFEHDIQYLEKSAKANSLLANEYFEMLRSPNKKYPDQVLIQKALKHYNLAVSNDSSFFSAYNNAGVIYFSYLNDIPSAKKYFTLAIRHRPLYAQAFENLGNCYKQEENITKSYECYKRSMEINPKQYSAHISCINLFFEKKLYDKALEIIEKAHINFPNSYELTAQEGNCYLMKQDTSSALIKYEEAYQLNPNHNLAQFLSQKYKDFRQEIKAEFYKNK